MKDNIRQLLGLFGIWLLVTYGYLIVTGLVTGALPIKTGQSYVWRSMLKTQALFAFEIGVLTVFSMWVFCRNKSKRWRMVCAGLLGLIIAPAMGFATGWVEEQFGHSVFFNWNVLEGWIWGLGLAVPNAVVASAISSRMQQQ